MITILLDISDIKSTEELYKLLKYEFKLPAFYGMNWDAFWDSITGLVAMPGELEITGLEKFSKPFLKIPEFLLNP